MVINGEYVLTTDEIEDQRMRALYACEKAQKNLDRLIAVAKLDSRKLYAVAKFLGDLQFDAPNPVTSEAQVLSLSKMEYDEALNLDTLKALANSIALARKELCDANEVKQKIG